MNENNSIGIIELGSIYKGFVVQDAILKGTDVTKMLSRTICSGKYLIMIRGSVSGIEAALEIAREQGGFAIIEAIIIPRVDPRIFSAISGNTTLQIEKPEVKAMIVMETFSVASAIKAADFAVKEAELEINRIHIAMAIGGKGYVVMTGDVDALQSAVIPAIEYVKDEGMLAGYSLIRHPHKELLKELL